MVRFGVAGGRGSWLLIDRYADGCRSSSNDGRAVGSIVEESLDVVLVVVGGAELEKGRCWRRCPTPLRASRRMS